MVGAYGSQPIENRFTDYRVQRTDGPIQAPRALRSVQHPPLLSSALIFIYTARARARRGRSRSVAYQQVVNLRVTSSATQIRVPTEGWTPLPVAAPKLRRRSPPALTVTAPPLSPPPPSPPPSTCRIPKHSRRVRTRTGHSIAASCQREHPARR